MPFNVKAGGSWRAANKIYARVAGSWVTAKQVWGYASGGWRSAWQNEIRYINTSNRTAASIFALMGSPTQPNTYIFENQATISAGTGSYALRTGVFPAGSIVKIVNKGYIVGKGGDGGSFNTAGGAGGTALYIDFPCTIDNAAGYIYGGGGGGGGARAYFSSTNPLRETRAGGGGGSGSNGGAAGTNSFGGGSLTTLVENTAPTAGTASSAGSRGVCRATHIAANQVGDSYGGAGGGLGTSGAAGSVTVVGWQSGGTSIGGAAGAAIAKNGNTLTITAGNDTTRIKGAVA